MMGAIVDLDIALAVIAEPVALRPGLVGQCEPGTPIGVLRRRAGMPRLADILAVVLGPVPACIRARIAPVGPGVVLWRWRGRTRPLIAIRLRTWRPAVAWLRMIAAGALLGKSRERQRTDEQQACDSREQKSSFHKRAPFETDRTTDSQLKAATSASWHADPNQTQPTHCFCEGVLATLLRTRARQRKPHFNCGF